MEASGTQTRVEICAVLALEWDNIDSDERYMLKVDEVWNSSSSRFALFR